MDKEKINRIELSDKELEQIRGGTYLGAAVERGTPVSKDDWCDNFKSLPDTIAHQCNFCIYGIPIDGVLKCLWQDNSPHSGSHNPKI